MKTHIATSTATTITVRGLDLTKDIIGTIDFVAMIYFLLTGRHPTSEESKLLDACLVTMMEHGWTPTSLIARMVFDSIPDQPQVGIAAGLLGVGDIYGGTMQNCAEILIRIGRSQDDGRECHTVVQEHRLRNRPIPGFGHPIHKQGDPRTTRLFEMARGTAIACRHIDLLERLSMELDQTAGKPIVINASGAVAAVLLDIGIPGNAVRSVAVISRAGGLAGHLLEEAQTHAARRIWALTEDHIPYEAPDTPLTKPGV